MFGATGVFGDDEDEEECLVCSEVDQMPKVSCSDCKRTLVHVHCAHGLDNCPFCRGVNFFEKSSRETQFLLTQYQNSKGPKSTVSFLIELYNENNKEEILKSVSSFDQIFEDSAQRFHGYVQRSLVCTTCSTSSSSLLKMTISQFGLLEGTDLKCQKCFNPALDKNFQLAKEIQKDGNFRNFEFLTFKKKNEGDIFLDGALKIKKSTKSPFAIRGRICRSTDFDRIVGHLKEVEKMVIIIIIIIIITSPSITKNKIF